MEIILAFSLKTKKIDGYFRFLKTSEGREKPFLRFYFEISEKYM